ncbi:MAG: DeoR family transcriptional regulator [Clostridiales bacterium]|nr:DeoR family transcriptional regulator [Clostridiales bacterium]
MESGFITLMRKLAPDLTEEMTRRALILERISVLQPVGRRQLAARLNLPEREIRNTAILLKDLGYLELDASGMSLSRKAEEVLESAREFSRAMNGLTETERRLGALLPADRILVAPGNADEDDQVLSDVGRLCAGGLKGVLQNGNTLAVTGGQTVAAVARNMQSPTPLNVMVVPARGGLGRSVELQANTLAEEIAGRLGGHYRLIHLPDRLDAAAMQEMLKMPEVSEAIELLERADIILHGIGIARESMKIRNLSRDDQSRLTREGAAGESFGAFYDLNGKCLLESSSVGVDLARLKPTCRMVAAAAGKSKAEAIISVLRHNRHHLLVTDQGAADEMIRILTA